MDRDKTCASILTHGTAHVHGTSDTTKSEKECSDATESKQPTHLRCKGLWSMMQKLWAFTHERLNVCVGQQRAEGGDVWKDTERGGGEGEGVLSRSVILL